MLEWSDRLCSNSVTPSTGAHSFAELIKLYTPSLLKATMSISIGQNLQTSLNLSLFISAHVAHMFSCVLLRCHLGHVV